MRRVLGVLGLTQALSHYAMATRTPPAVRFGIIGPGSVTEKKSGPALYKAPHSQLVAIYRRNEDKARSFAQRHSETAGYSIRVEPSAEALIMAEDVDVVYIATPPREHFHFAMLACAHGKAAYVEKPLARTYEEAEQIVQAFAEKGLPLFCGYYRRYLPKFLAVRENLPRVGPVSEVRIRLTQRRYVPGKPIAFDWRVDPEVTLPNSRKPQDIHCGMPKTSRI
eukprot:scaffold3499_cov247-Pinguiococcus_pyrenoidosus.AAC.4